MFRIWTLMTFIFVASYSSVATEIKSVKLGGFNYPPFYMKENGVAKGAGVDLARELFKRLNIEQTVSIYPMSRLLYTLQTGVTDGALFLLKTEERSKYLAYTQPLITIPGQLWSLAGRKDGVIELNQMKEVKVGVTQGYSYGEKLDSTFKTMKTISAYSDYANYKLLLEGRIDAFPGNEIVAKSLFKKHHELNGKFVHAKESFVDWEFHMVISKESPLVELIPEINKEINRLHKEGVIDEIIAKYTN